MIIRVLAILLLHYSGLVNADGQTIPLLKPANQVVDKSAIIAQALIPEGVYALQLAETLKLGILTDHGAAEQKLSAIGIEPENGWLADYPVTPVVLSELDKDIDRLAEQGKLESGKPAVLAAVKQLKMKLGLNISTATSPVASTGKSVGQTGKNSAVVLSTIYAYVDSSGAKFFTDNFKAIPPEYQKKAHIVSQSNVSTTPPDVALPPTKSSTAPVAAVSPLASDPPPTPVIDQTQLIGYYQTQGPPAITYYPPPVVYAYLYTWIPYQFWSNGDYFAGYFMLNNFQQQIVYNQTPYFVSYQHGRAQQNISNPGNTHPAAYANPTEAAEEHKAHTHPELSQPNQLNGGGHPANVPVAQYPLGNGVSQQGNTSHTDSQTPEIMHHPAVVNQVQQPLTATEQEQNSDHQHHHAMTTPVPLSAIPGQEQPHPQTVQPQEVVQPPMHHLETQHLPTTMQMPVPEQLPQHPQVIQQPVMQQSTEPLEHVHTLPGETVLPGNTAQPKPAATRSGFR